MFIYRFSSTLISIIAFSERKNVHFLSKVSFRSTKNEQIEKMALT